MSAWSTLMTEYSLEVWSDLLPVTFLCPRQRFGRQSVFFSCVAITCYNFMFPEQALLNKYRAQAARAGLLIRPNLNIKLGVKESEREEAEAERCLEPEPHAGPNSPREPEYTQSESLYLQTHSVKHGVFQVQRVPNLEIRVFMH